MELTTTVIPPGETLKTAIGNTATTITGDEGITVTVAGDKAVTGDKTVTVAGDKAVKGDKTVTVAGDKAATGDKTVTGAGDKAVTRDKTVTVAGDKAVTRDKTVTVAGDKAVTGDKTVTVAGDKAVTGDKTVTVAGEKAVTGDKTVTGAGDKAVTGDKTVTVAGDKAVTGDKTATIVSSKISEKPEVQCIILDTDMTEELQKEVMEMAKDAWEKFPIKNFVYKPDEEDAIAPELGASFEVSTQTAHEQTSNHYAHMAQHIKTEIDKKYRPCWHVIVGNQFGCFMTHDNGTFIYFHMGEDRPHILMFKSGTLDQPLY